MTGPVNLGSALAMLGASKSPPPPRMVVVAMTEVAKSRRVLSPSLLGSSTGLASWPRVLLKIGEHRMDVDDGESIRLGEDTTTKPVVLNVKQEPSTNKYKERRSLMLRPLILRL